MKKILIINNNMHVGGVQKALVSLLWNIWEQYDVTLLLFHSGGENRSELPPGVKVITLSGGYQYLGMPSKDAVTRKDSICRSFYAAITRIFGRKYAVALMGLGQTSLEGYDVAISYLHNSKDKAFYGGCNDFLLKHVSAKKKVTFLHCDYNLSGANTPDNNRQYGEMDVIAACSHGCAEAFLKANPNLADKVVVVPNCHRFEQIQEMAAVAPVSLPQDRINIVTVARLGKEKGVERALQAIAGLGSLREQVHHYIIGDGSEKAVLLETLEREKLQPYVTLCGQLENPYGYMQAADLLLIPSRSEAAPLVISEAASLGTPILSMKTSSALEMIEETGFGWVCENEVQAMTDALKNLIENPEILKTAEKTLNDRKFDNKAALLQFSKCLE